MSLEQLQTTRLRDNTVYNPHEMTEAEITTAKAQKQVGTVDTRLVQLQQLKQQEANPNMILTTQNVVNATGGVPVSSTTQYNNNDTMQMGNTAHGHHNMSAEEMETEQLKQQVEREKRKLEHLRQARKQVYSNTTRYNQNLGGEQHMDVNRVPIQQNQEMPMQQHMDVNRVPIQQNQEMPMHYQQQVINQEQEMMVNGEMYISGRRMVPYEAYKIVAEDSSAQAKLALDRQCEILELTQRAQQTEREVDFLKLQKAQDELAVQKSEEEIKKLKFDIESAEKFRKQDRDKLHAVQQEMKKMDSRVNLYITGNAVQGVLFLIVCALYYFKKPDANITTATNKTNKVSGGQSVSVH